MKIVKIFHTLTTGIYLSRTTGRFNVPLLAARWVPPSEKSALYQTRFSLFFFIRWVRDSAVVESYHPDLWLFLVFLCLTALRCLSFTLIRKEKKMTRLNAFIEWNPHLPNNRCRMRSPLEQYTWTLPSRFEVCNPIPLSQGYWRWILWLGDNCGMPELCLATRKLEITFTYSRK